MNNSARISRILKKAALAIVLGTISYVTTWGQDFIQLIDGEKIIGTIEYHTPAFQQHYFVVNGTARYDVASVIAFQSGPDYYRKINPSGTAPKDFYLRTAQGKIDVFSKASTQVMYSQNGMTTMNNRWDYYAFGDGPLKKLRYRFVKKDLQHSQAARAELKKITPLRWLSAGLYLGGSTLLVTSIAGMNDLEENSIPAGVIVGAVAFTSAFWLLNTKRNRLITVIEAYNAETTPTSGTNEAPKQF